MTVNTVNITSGPYIGNGLSADYSYTFRITDKTQLSIYETTDAGIQTLLTVDTDYTVAGIGDDGGGVITRIAGNLPIDYKWYIRSNYVENQLTAFRSQGGFFPGVHEDQMDHITFLIQQLRDESNRSMRLADLIDIDGDFTLSDDAIDRANKFLAFDANGDLIVSTNAGISVPLSAFMTTVLAATDPDDATTLLKSPFIYDNKAAAVLVEPINGKIYHIGGTDGGIFKGVTGAAPGTYSDNGYIDPTHDYCGTVFIPTGGDGSRAYLRLDGGYNVGLGITPKMFGSDVDNDAAFTLMVAAGHALKLPMNLGGSENTYTVTGEYTIDLSKTTFKGSGAKVYYNKAVTATLLTITNTEANVNKRGLWAMANAIDGIFFEATGKAVAGVRFCTIEDSVSNSMWGVSFKNGGVFGFAEGIYFGNGSFMCSTDTWAMLNNGWCLNIPSATNSGERNEFINSTFTNNDTILIQANGNSSTIFNGCSLDYSTRMMTITQGDVFITGSHIEHGSAADNWFHVSGDNSTLSISQTAIVLNNTTADLVNTPFYCDSTTVMGGIYISDCDLWTNSTYTVDVLISGTGVSNVDNIRYFKNAKKPALSRYDNDVAYGDIESANYANDYALSGTVIPVQTAAKAYSGANSLYFYMLGGTASKAIVERECRQGDMISGHFYYQTTIAAAAGGSGATFYVTVKYLDYAGAAISTSARLTETTDKTSWTLLEFGRLDRAPSGTVKYQLTMEVFGASSAPAGEAWIDDLIINRV